MASTEPRDVSGSVHDAELWLRAADHADVLALNQALKVEALDQLPRARVTIEDIAPGDESGRFLMRVEAEDLVSLRAALNSFLKWAIAADASLAAAQDLA